MQGTKQMPANTRIKHNRLCVGSLPLGDNDCPILHWLYMAFLYQALLLRSMMDHVQSTVVCSVAGACSSIGKINGIRAFILFSFLSPISVS